MVTIKEIAKRCNVSIATVSNIINGKPNVGRETREKVLKTIEELNYTPNYIAKNLKTIDQTKPKLFLTINSLAVSSPCCAN